MTVSIERAESVDLLKSGLYRVMLRVESIQRGEHSSVRDGAYTNGAIHRCVYDRGIDYSTEAHPGPNLDAGIRDFWIALGSSHEREPYLFGFGNFSQFVNWFYVDAEAQPRLTEENQYSVLGVYIVSREASKMGQFQMVGHKECMLHVMDLPMNYKLNATLEELYMAQRSLNTPPNK